MKPEFFIKEGVRRAVAAREAGLLDIPARIIELGKPDVLVRLLLDQLFSPKPFVIRDFRYIRFTEYPTLVLKRNRRPLMWNRGGCRVRKSHSSCSGDFDVAMNVTENDLHKRLLYVLHLGLAEIRNLALAASQQQIADLADAMEILPG